MPKYSRFTLAASIGEPRALVTSRRTLSTGKVMPSDGMAFPHTGSLSNTVF